jgi:hypothetical protein
MYNGIPFIRLVQLLRMGLRQELLDSKTLSKRVWISKVPTHTFWFCRFATGIDRRVGEIKKQDKAVTINTLHASEKILEKRWRQATTAEAKRDVARLGA